MKTKANDMRIAETIKAIQNLETYDLLYEFLCKYADQEDPQALILLLLLYGRHRGYIFEENSDQSQKGGLYEEKR